MAIFKKKATKKKTTTKKKASPKKEVTKKVTKEAEAPKTTAGEFSLKNLK